MATSKDKTPPTKGTRMIRLDRGMVKPEERTFDLAFSSELPVVQYWGIEILSHDPGAMRMDRAKGGIAMLFNRP
jgi:hypothetical protein